LGAGLRGNGASKQIYEKNPLSKSAEFTQNNVAPHVETIRATYTTPNVRLAQIEMIELFVFRKTAGSSIGNVEVKIDSSIRGRLATIIFRDNTVGEFNSQDFSKTLLLESGEIITITTEDDSTGGQINYSINVGITEFDLFWLFNSKLKELDQSLILTLLICLSGNSSNQLQKIKFGRLRFLITMEKTLKSITKWFILNTNSTKMNLIKFHWLRDPDWKNSQQLIFKRSKPIDERFYFQTSLSPD